MTRRIVLTALALLACATVASAGVVDPTTSSAVQNNEPVEPDTSIVLTVTPCGEDGLNFPNDHIITAYVNDSSGAPVEILATDLWLESDDQEPCPGGWIADSSTFAPDPGVTTFSALIRGGVPLGASCRDMVTKVVAAGQVIQELGMRINSPDLNGDHSVGAIDFAKYATFHNQPCSDEGWCADYDESDESEFDPPPDHICVGAIDLSMYATWHNFCDCP
jgi:hypothetical protein